MQTAETDAKPDSFFRSQNLPQSSHPSKVVKPFSRGHWKSSEQQCYTAFLRKNYHIMRSSRLRYHYKIFNAMAEEVGTRTSAQCKSHHQKMLKRADNRLENLLLADQGPIPTPGLQQNDLRRMTDQITTNRTNPYFMVHFGNKLLIVVD
jgi:hypothetical protein